MRIVPPLFAVLAAGWLSACPPGAVEPGPDPADDDDSAAGADDDDDSAAEDPWPALLSETGLYTDISSESLASGVMPYDVAWPFWTDGAAKARFLSLPEGTQIDTYDPNLWTFPVGTKAWKHFAYDGVKVETRLVEHTEDGWTWVSYQWREDGTDADVVPLGVTNANERGHDIPSSEQCAMCHLSEGFVGIGAIQFGDDNPSAPLEALAAGGRISHPIEQSTAVPGEGAAREALGYLHGNCGYCHADHFWLAPNYTLRLRMLVGTQTPAESQAESTGVNAMTHHDLGTTVAIAPGDPEASQVFQRMAERSLLQMPPLGTERVDEVALEAVREWIENIPAPE